MFIYTYCKKKKEEFLEKKFVNISFSYISHLIFNNILFLKITLKLNVHPDHFHFHSSFFHIIINNPLKKRIESLKL